MKNTTLLILLSLFIISCDDKNRTSSSKSPTSNSSTSSSSSKSYKNVSGGSSSHISTCSTCGTSYTVKVLPYKGKYCSSSCCKVWSELGDPGCE